MKRVIKVRQDDLDYRLKEITGAVTAAIKSQDVLVTISDPTRSLEQNAAMWAMLGDISEQVQWAVDGHLTLIPAEDWKDIFSAAHKRDARIASGIDGGFVMLGGHTSRMTKQALSDLIELIAAFGAERGVKWSAPARYEEAAG